MYKKVFAVVSILLIAGLALSACTTTPDAPTAAPAATDAPIASEVPVEEVVTIEEQPFGDNLPTAPTIDIPLVVAYQDFSQKFSPFFADTGYDMDVASLTQISLLTTDRVGGIIFNAIEGEMVNYNGTDYFYKGPADTKVEYDEASDTTKYTAKLRVGMKFSDGKPVTIDDLIFSYYTFLDPSYVGSTTLSSYDILGLADYQTQTTSEVFDKYAAIAEEILAAGADHVWAATDTWTQEQQEDYWTRVNTAWMDSVVGIVDYVKTNYLDAYGEEIMGLTPEVISENEGIQIAFGMAIWGFGEMVDGQFVAAVSGDTYDLITTFPTIEDYYNETYAAYEGNLVEYASVEDAAGADLQGNVNSAFIGLWGPQDESMGGEGVPNIAGIVKVDDYTAEVTVKGFSAPAVYSILGIQVSPLHYYGDVAKYDYDNNMFGFDFGDLSKQLSLTATPMGAGAYKFVEYDNRVVYFTANESYYRGCPKIAEVQFKETTSAEVASAVQTGTADAGEMTGSRSRFDEVASYNANGEITGDIITTSKVDNLGYGYAGINAGTVNVAGEADSDASKSLRKGLATILAVYRDVAIDSYYGEAASVINYPISNTSWAAPQPTDGDYKIAFSTDVDGNPIYTADMTPEEKYAAAETAALGFFEDAGYTVAGGKVTAAPEEAKLSYEVIVPGDGTGDHPAFAILTGAQASLENIGMELKINDPADSNILWDALDAGTQELWTAAWGATIDPDMYQVYHSSGVVGEGGSDSNHYQIRDAGLDQLIVDARKSDDQSYRKAIYKQALDTLIDWAVEIPTYQRQNSIIFSTVRMDIDTITPDITTFWGWMEDLELVEMR
ncbi:MAG: ABC transporter substrate-binding protein [Candidatus Hatepunaea meridiana]|nr:ABC transporter substrate-binding protein [Candidatus Hatepunaea meridiana]